MDFLEIMDYFAYDLNKAEEYIDERNELKKKSEETEPERLCGDTGIQILVVSL